MTSRTGWTADVTQIAAEATRLYRFLSLRQRAALLCAALLMAGVGYATARIPVTLGALLDGMLHGKVTSLRHARPYLVALAITFLVREVLQVVRKIMVERTCTDVERSALVAVVGQLLAIDLSVLGADRAGSWNGRINKSVEGVVRLLKLGFLDFFPAMFGAIFALSAAVSKNAALGSLMALMVPVGTLIVAAQLASQRGVRVWLLRAKEKLDGTIVEQLGGIETVRAAHTLNHELSKVSRIADELRRKEFKHHIAMALFDALKSLNEGFFHISVITAAIVIALAGRATPGDVLAFSILFMAVVAPMREMHRIIDEGHESGLRTATFFGLLGQPRDRSFDPVAGIRGLAGGDTIIDAHHLCVRYPGAAGPTPMVRDVTLKIRTGEVIGFAGPSGSGKTTFIRTLLRLVHPCEGQLMVAGSPIEGLDREEIGRLFGYVGQTPFLFSGTISENIAYSSPRASHADIVRAAKLARIDGEIDALPDGYNHIVSEKGSNLSGGQRQRIALARVFLQGPPILILDEATAALDNENEAAVMASVLEATQTRTVLIVAHRLSTLRNTERIYVFKDGEVCESGSFDALAQMPGGVFANLLLGRDDHANPKAAVSGKEEPISFQNSSALPHTSRRDSALNLAESVAI